MEKKEERSCKTCLYSMYASSDCPSHWELDCDAAHKDFVGKEISNCSSYTEDSMY